MTLSSDLTSQICFSNSERFVFDLPLRAQFIESMQDIFTAPHRGKTSKFDSDVVERKAHQLTTQQVCLNISNRGMFCLICLSLRCLCRHILSSTDRLGSLQHRSLRLESLIYTCCMQVSSQQEHLCICHSHTNETLLERVEASVPP